ncbi:hypothetical protein C0992_001051 [Termitomyces sp. T32_za158]|nr:hypothetical protein C0992_001051 [Termitomyces sp. T32_za158]
MAAANGHFTAVQCLYEPHRTQSGGQMAFLIAAYREHFTIVRWLVRQNIGINNQFTTLLKSAINNGDLVKTLAELGIGIQTKTSDLGKALFIATEIGLLDVVKTLIDYQDELFKVKSETKDSLLHRAAEYGQINIVKFLDAKHVEYNMQNMAGNTALHLAANGNDESHLDVIRWLRNKDNAQHCKNALEELPIHLAVRHGNIKAVEALYSLENIDETDKFGNTPLHLAANNGKLEVVEWLVNHRAKMDKTNENEETPLFVAGKHEYWKIVKFLVSRGQNINAKNKSSDTLLHNGARTGNLKAVEWLVNNDADINAKNGNNETPLLTAAKSGKLGILEFLASKEKNVHVTRKSKTIEHNIEGMNEDLQAIEWQIRNNAELDITDDNKATSLLRAARFGKIEVVKLLASKGQDVNTRAKDQNTPLHVSAENGHLDTVQWLFENGAQIDARSKAYLYYNYTEILAFKDNYKNTALHLSAGNGHLNTVKWLIKNGAQIDAKNNNQATSLLRAARFGKLEVVKFLASEGQDVNTRAKNQDTPLHVSAENGYLDIVQWLVENGAQMDARNDNEATSLLKAAKFGKLEVVKLLASKGQDINTRDIYNIKAKDQNTPLHVSAENGHLDTVQWLFENGAQIDARSKAYLYYNYIY